MIPTTILLIRKIPISNVWLNETLNQNCIRKKKPVNERKMNKKWKNFVKIIWNICWRNGRWRHGTNETNWFCLRHRFQIKSFKRSLNWARRHNRPRNWAIVVTLSYSLITQQWHHNVNWFQDRPHQHQPQMQSIYKHKIFWLLIKLILRSKVVKILIFKLKWRQRTLMKVKRKILVTFKVSHQQDKLKQLPIKSLVPHLEHLVVALEELLGEEWPQLVKPRDQLEINLVWIPQDTTEEWPHSTKMEKKLIRSLR